VEISATDARLLGLAPPLRLSGDLAASSAIILHTDHGQVALNQGVIIARRHLHILPAQAAPYYLHDGQIVSARIGGQRGGLLDQILVRITPDSALDLHLDTDEGNALGVKTGDQAEIIIHPPEMI
jgi:putative phosphotransacetylase